MLKIKFISILVILLMLLPSIALAQDIEVTKTAPSQINFGDNLKATITVVNKLSQQVVVMVRENIGDAQTIEPQLITPQSKPGMIAARPPYFEWSLTIDANSQKDVSYTIKPNKVGYYLFSPTIVTTNNGNTFYSNTFSTLVKCNTNKICEQQYGEDYTNCPEDCSPPTNSIGTSPSPIISFGSSQIIIIIVAIVIIIGVGIFFFKRKSHKKARKKQRKRNKLNKGE